MEPPGGFFAPKKDIPWKKHQQSEGWKSSLLRNTVFLLGKKVVTKTFFLEVKMSNTWGEKYIIPNGLGVLCVLQMSYDESGSSYYVYRYSGF